MSKKRQRRIKDTNEAYEEAVLAEAVEKRLESAEDSALFVLDRQGSKRAKRRVEVEIVPKKQGTFLTRADRAVLRKIQASREASPAPSKANKAAELSDLWGNDSKQPAPSKRRAEIRQHKLSVPTPGQSYHPSQDSHQDALAEVLAVELVRQEAEKDKLPDQLQLQNRDVTQLLLDDAYCEGEHDASDDDGASSESRPVVRKQPAKITKAQRNRQRAHKDRLSEARARKNEAALLQSIDRLEHVQREIDREAKRQEQQSRAAAARKATPTPKQSLDINSVALSDELRGSLRTLKPKGVPLREAVKTLVEAGDANAQTPATRHKGEHPHKARQIKWFAKYKY